MFYPSLLWRMPKTGEKTIYLTFDDGPHPATTPIILKILRRYNAKATFFCIGNNVKNYPKTFELIKKEGHAVGIHTFNHENGWKTRTADYVKSVVEANELIHSDLFRPPYGKIKHSQIKRLKTLNLNTDSQLSTLNSQLQIVVWTVIAYDWDRDLSSKQVYKNVIRNAGDGAIVALHDSFKSYTNTIMALPKLLEYYTKRGFIFKAL
ncbi:MAG: polysaccharide deacetylase family protein [Bacteroidales bacterium]|nr:polysaccharide deacetylase family protein [Bacteroidales bacterium]